MTRISVLLAVLSIGLLSSCGVSPLYVGDEEHAIPGTIPRDIMGEPIWDQIEPK